MYPSCKHYKDVWSPWGAIKQCLTRSPKPIPIAACVIADMALTWLRTSCVETYMGSYRRREAVQGSTGLGLLLERGDGGQKLISDSV